MGISVMCELLCTKIRYLQYHYAPMIRDTPTSSTLAPRAPRGARDPRVAAQCRLIAKQRVRAREWLPKGLFDEKSMQLCLRDTV